MDYYVKSVIPIIESNYENFTALERTIADFFMKNQKKLIFRPKRLPKIICVRSILIEIRKEMRISGIP